MKGAMVLHKNLTHERWFKFSLIEQLANVETDIDRAIQAKNNQGIEASHAAFRRALELLDATISDPKNNNHRIKELLMTRDALKDYFLYNNEYRTTDKIWQDYFYQFNYAAALQNGK